MPRSKPIDVPVSQDSDFVGFHFAGSMSRKAYGRLNLYLGFTGKKVSDFVAAAVEEKLERELTPELKNRIREALGIL